jgi:hypothetical protein
MIHLPLDIVSYVHTLPTSLSHKKKLPSYESPPHTTSKRTPPTHISLTD